MTLESDLPECETCEGRGVRNCIVRWSNGTEGDAEKECDDCNGTGHISADEHESRREDAEAEREIDRLDAIGLDPWGNEK
jgi:DnaJ-class molecular chaperone